MILFFGPSGAGKSVQGQFLAARQGWRWLSAGQLLRDTRDQEVLRSQHEGKLVTSDKVNQIISDALNRATNIDQIILDGFPRMLDQAKWLVDSRPMHG
ncbi:AAA family ATPase, partial [Candidatus Saccharibacteria bacterium]|nr:AAA family ATPase [Candidatus Saccharibacteria bacterium]